MPRLRFALLITSVVVLAAGCGEERRDNNGGGDGPAGGPGGPGGDPGEGEGEIVGGGPGGDGDEGEGEGEVDGGGEAGEGEVDGGGDGGEGEGDGGDGGEGEGEGEVKGGEGEGEGEGEVDPGPAACGGIAGLACPAPDEQFCAYEAGDCGLADALGDCRPRPEFCAQDCPRVCGCDGVEYCNECGAAANGVSILNRGGCGELPEPPNDCIPTDHPDVTVVGDGDECQLIDFGCGEGEQIYEDDCSCGCIADEGDSFACADNSDCVPEDCCRPTGCVVEAAQECQTEGVCCDCDDCLPAVQACGCINGLCRTTWDFNACE